MGEQRSQSPVENQTGIEKLVIETRTDLNDNDQGTKNRTTKQIYGTGIPPKETTVTTKEMKIRQHTTSNTKRKKIEPKH